MTIVEILGTSGAGKTTQIDYLTKELEKQGTPATIIGRPLKPGKEYSSPAEFHDHYLTNIEEGIEKHKDGMLIFDRGAFDRERLKERDYIEGILSEEEHKSFTKRINHAKSKIDHGLVFMLSPEQSIERLKSQKKQSADLSYLNKGLFPEEDLDQSYQEHEQLLKMNPALKRIDASLPKEQTLKYLLSHIS